MRVALYEPPGPRSDSYPFGASRLADLVELALGICAHQVSRIPARPSDESIGPGFQEAGAEARWLIDHFRTAQRPPPDIWISSRLSDRAVDVIGPAVSAAFGIPYVLLQPETPASETARDSREAREVLETVRAADAAIVFSSAHAASYRQAVPDPGDRLIILPPFIDLDQILSTTRSRIALRRAFEVQLRIRPDIPWLIAAGPMSSARDVDSFRLVARAVSASANLESQLIVAGNGPRRAEVEGLFQSLPRRIDRHLPISTPEALAALLAAGDVFLWPAVDEAFSLTTVEAQAAGLAVVSCRSPGVVDVLAEGQTGLLAKPDNDASFINAAAFALRHPEFRRTFAGNGPKWVGKHFDIHVVAPRLSDAIRRIRDGFRPDRPQATPPAQ